MIGINSDATSVFPRYLSRSYPSIERGEGVWLYTAEGDEILDACSGGAMVASLGHGRDEIVEATWESAGDIAYMYNQFFTNQPQEQLAQRLLDVAAPEMARARFVSGGAEANETALRLARTYHVDRGDTGRWRVISPAQSYHGATMATLALSGRTGLQTPFDPYMAKHLHIPPSTKRFDPTGEGALDALDQVLEEAGPETVAAFFCEPVSAAALPAYSPPTRFWEGLAERRERHGFLVCFDEIVTGIGRTGRWFAGQGLPIEPDIVTAGKTLGAGYAPLAGTLCREHVYEVLANGSRAFDLGHTWDGAPLPCAVGLAVLDFMINNKLLDRVAARGPSFRDELESALAGCDIVGEVRGHGFLLGVDYVDPRDGQSLLPDSLDAATLIDDKALEQGLLVTSTHSTRDGFTGDQTLLAPAYTSKDEELAEMINRFVKTLEKVEHEIKAALGRTNQS
ncbi:MAG: aminotransferase class III-fold pyridoxal phosphate-dependent enzyme [Arenicellales bacterium]|nr:aminotransferase class III-fold pyridoxal phosphate-dependent enzyme [Arenicellales bacterium]